MEKMESNNFKKLYLRGMQVMEVRVYIKNTK
jgi:hypothetical protein